MTLNELNSNATSAMNRRSTEANDYRIIDSIRQTIIFPVWFNVRVWMRRVLGNQCGLQQSTQFL